jgi:hypothetical protein
MQGRIRQGAWPAAAAGLIAAAALVSPSVARAAAVQHVEPPAGAALVEGVVTLRWNLDVTWCDPGKPATTSVEVWRDGQVAVAPGALPEPQGSGLDASLFAAAASGAGFRFSTQVVGRPDGSPSRYVWRARLVCTAPGAPPDPTQAIDVVGAWSEFAVTRAGAAPGTTPPPPAPPAPATSPPPVPRPRVGGGPGRITGFLGWTARDAPLPTPFKARQVPRPLTPAGGTITSCARGPRGLLLVFRHAGFPRPRRIRWTWRLDGRPIVSGRGRIGVAGGRLFAIWMGYRGRAAPNGVYSVSLRLGRAFFGSAAVRRAC